MYPQSCLSVLGLGTAGGNPASAHLIDSAWQKVLRVHRPSTAFLPFHVSMTFPFGVSVQK